MALRKISRAALLGAVLAGCQPAESVEHRDPEGAADSGVRAGVVVDSIRPIEEELALFRASLPDHPSHLTGGAPSVAELVAALAAAVNEPGAAEAMADLAINRSEFAYFHYPYTRFARPPYELSPALVWYRLTGRSEQGLKRLVATFGAGGLRVVDVSCESPTPAGPGRIHDCTPAILDGDGRRVELRMFGQILERDGRYKFVSFTNDL